MRDKKKKLLLWILCILFLASLILYGEKNNWFGLIATSKRQSDILAAEALAQEAVSLFYTLDYREDPQAWLSRICAVSTETGCAITRLSQEMTWNKLIDQRVITMIDILGTEKMPVDLPDCPACQVWQVEICPGVVWTGLQKPATGTQVVYVLLEQVGDQWLLDHILFQEEIQALEREVAYE